MNTAAVLKAARFAAEAHKYQKRKGEAKRPYIVHPLRVAEIVAAHSELDSTIAVIAALLHDVIEDTGYDYRDIEGVFGSEVAELVNEVTFINKDKDAKIARAPSLSPKAKAIKVADLVANLEDLTEDRAAFTPENRLRYVNYAIAMKDAMGPVGYYLDGVFDNAVLNFFKEI